MSTFLSLGAVCRVSDAQLQVVEHCINWRQIVINPLSPHDALKHHFTSLKIDLIFQQPRVLERTFPKKLVCQYMTISLNFSLTSNHLHRLQVENCDSNSRLVVDEDDNGKFRLERVKWCNRVKEGPNKSVRRSPFNIQCIFEINNFERILRIINNLLQGLLYINMK